MGDKCRREFLRKIFTTGAALASGGNILLSDNDSFSGDKGLSPGGPGKYSSFAAGKMYRKDNRTGKEAMFYRQTGNQSVQCRLCPHMCNLDEGESGFCRVRENVGGKLYSMVYGYPCTYDIGPIEKAPLHHFVPGHSRLCVATVGCNFRCSYCHNWHISQKSPGQVREYEMSPEDIVEEASESGVDSVSFTYTEPTVFFEYMYDICRLAKNKGLKTSIVSNGFINPEPLRKLLVYLDAVKIDLKSFNDQFYKEVSSGRLEPVKRSLKVVKEEGVFFEIVNLVVPGLNDDPDELRSMCSWIRQDLGGEVPVHFSRFSPTYQLTDLESTPVETLEVAVEIAHEEGLKYLYIGNVPGHKRNSTFCPGCEEELVLRSHFTILSNNIEEGQCKFCGYSIAGVWEVN